MARLRLPEQRADDLSDVAIPHDSVPPAWLCWRREKVQTRLPLHSTCLAPSFALHRPLGPVTSPAKVMCTAPFGTLKKAHIFGM